MNAPSTPPDAPLANAAPRRDTTDTAPSGISSTRRSLERLLGFSEQQVLVYFMVVVILLELGITAVALLYSVTHVERMSGGGMRFNFPWMGYLIGLVLAPIILMLLTHLVRFAFGRGFADDAPSQTDLDNMPHRARTFFAMVRGAPTLILFMGIIIIGMIVYYMDGIMTLLLGLGDDLPGILIWSICALVTAWCLMGLFRLWMLYRVRHMEAEFAFRREVLERTGMVILDRRQELTNPADLAALPAAGSAVLTSTKLYLDAGSEQDNTAPKAEDHISRAD